MAGAAVRLSTVVGAGLGVPRLSTLPALPSRPHSISNFARNSHYSISTSSSTLLLGPSKFQAFPVRATSSDESSIQAEDIVSSIKEKWDAVENKSSVLIYGGGALLAVWVSSIIVGAINSVPLLPKVMELIGLGYTGWFVYRYLLFKSSRKELARDIEEIKKKITGTTVE